MNSFACRVFQYCFGAGARLLPWRTPEVYMGDGSLLRVADILRENSLRRPFVIASRRQCADEHFRRLQEVLDMQDILLMNVLMIRNSLMSVIRELLMKL